jgi:membrane-associated phospholipid phosphatase
VSTEIRAESSAINFDLTEADSSHWRGRCGALLKASLHEDALLIGGTVLYVACSFIAQRLYGISISPLTDIWRTYVATAGAFLLAGFCVFALWFIYLKRIRRQANLLDYVSGQLAQMFSLERICQVLPILSIWPCFISAFSFLKVLIPRMRPFQFDQPLMELDRFLHLGRHPFEWLSPVLDHPIPMFILNWIYAVWFLVFMTVLLMQMANMSQPHLRAQYLLGQFLLWLFLGTVLATLLSSAGPAYYGLLNSGPNPYAAHFDKLRDIAGHWQFTLFGLHIQMPFTALQLQQMLWTSYQHTDFLGLGISACPSLHVASAWMIARLGQAYGRRHAICGYGFLVLVMLGSIQLGWHYAVDGYIGLIGAWLCWHVAGFVVARRQARGVADPMGH